MYLERTGDSNFPFEIRFTSSEEVRVVTSAFREEIYRRVEKGNSGSISRWDVYAASRHEDSFSLKVRAIEDVTDVLDRFHEGTDEAIDEIPEITNQPPYANKQIPDRFLLGRLALRLSDDIKGSLVEEINPDEAAEQLRSDLDSFGSQGE